MESRVCDDIIDGNKVEAVYRIMHDFDLVIVGGCMGVGKTTFIKNYKPKNGVTFSLWQKQKIMKMLIANAEFDVSLYSDINKFEKSVFTKLLSLPSHQVVTEGWFSKAQQRGLVKSWHRFGRIGIFMLDGPEHLILERLMKSEDYPFWSDAEKRYNLSIQLSTFRWPTRQEGMKIFYVNTFGEEGVQYLLNTCHLDA